MPDHSKEQPSSQTSRSLLANKYFRTLLVALVIALGWKLWKAHQLSIAVEEAKALGWVWSDQRALRTIKKNWRAAFDASTWNNDEPALTISEASEFDNHTDLVRRLAPRKLRVHDIESWTDLTHIRGLTSVRNLSLGAGRNVISLDGLESLTNLEKLFAPGRNELRNIEAIRGLKKLRILTISLPPEMTNISIAAGLTNLKIITVIHGRKLTDITALSNHPTLEEIALNDVERLPDLTPLATILDLRTLSLANVDDPSNLATFPAIPGLKTIYVPFPAQIPQSLRDIIKSRNPNVTFSGG